MMGPAWLSLCMALVLCAGGALTQIAPDTSMIQFEVFLQNMSFSAKDDLKDKSSQIYAEMKAQVEEAFQSLGGTLEDVLFSDGGGCVKMFVSWKNSDQNAVMAVFDNLKNNGFMIWGEKWMVSFSSCGASSELHMLRFKFYVVDMPWSDAMKSQGTAEHQQLVAIVQNKFSDLGGSIRTLQVAQNNGCVEFYVEWEATKPTNILGLMENLRTNGVTVLNVNFKVQTKPCLPSAGEIDECPKVPSDVFGTCDERCSDANPCPEGFKCCSNGCGHACARVGYTVKINSSVVIDMPWMIDMNNPQGTVYSQIQSAAKQMFNEAFNRGAEQSVVDVEVKRIRRGIYQGRAVSILDLMIYLSNDTLNSMLMESGDLLNQMTAMIGTTRISVLDVQLSNDSVSYMCGGMKCKGICKELRSGLQYCSCNPGYFGPDCSAFDCRSDLSQLPGLNNNQCSNGGDCVQLEDAEGLECQCQPGYYGHLCQARLCDLLNNPCSGQGTCVGDLASGKLCECNANRGGLFCEESLQVARENLTVCEQQRRLSEFVHGQLKGEVQASVLMAPMGVILHRIGQDVYFKPYCRPRLGNSQDGQFYSMCMYNATNANKKECFCVNSSGSRNYWYYFGEDSCRVFSGQLYNVTADFSILDAAWSDSLEDEESELYMQIKNQITEAMSPLGGYAAVLKFMNSGNCIGVHMVWAAETQEKAKETLMALMNMTISYNRQSARLSREPCEGTGELHMLQVKFYVVGLPWSEDFRSPATANYQNIKMFVEMHFSDLGGTLRTMEMAKNYGCIEFFLEWETMHPANILGLMGDLKLLGVTWQGQNYKVQTKPCLPTPAEVDECPEVPMDMMGTCIEMCNDNDPAMKCPEGKKCCSNGCGHVCKLVGYTVKINTTIVIGMPWMDGMDIKSGPAFLQAQTIAKQLVTEAFNLGSETSVVEIELKSISPTNRKDTMTQVPKLSLLLYFSNDPANNLLEESRDRLLQMSPMVENMRISVLEVNLVNTSSRCDGTECHGICKELRSGLQYCSCSAGYAGPDCTFTDCRADTSRLPQADNNICSNGGECLPDTSENGAGLRCQCPPGYYGALCQVRLCDLLNNPCNGQGTCVGDVSEGMICKCNDYRGGLQCENAIQTQTENLSVCQRQRRLMEFVHAQVKGSSQPEWMTLPMIEILQKMGEMDYSIPYCSSRAGDFYSMCVYDSMSGRKDKCFCVSSNGVSNSWIYISEDECRVYGSMTPVSGQFFILDTLWSDSLTDKNSERYKNLSEMISTALQTLSVYQIELKFTDYVGCLGVDVNGVTDNYSIVKDFIFNLTQLSIRVDEQMKTLSREPCEPVVDLNACPPIDRNDGLLGLCAFTCQLEGDSCEEGKKCCKNSCGGSACIEVGYLQKMLVNITVDEDYMEYLSDPSSIEYQALISGLSVIDVKMKEYGLRGYKSVKVLGFGRSVNEPATRGKRQAIAAKLVIMLEMKFTEEIPVEDMLRVKEDLMTNGFTVLGVTYRLLDITFGNKQCLGGSCAEGSICVTRIGDTPQCACPKSRTGQFCDHKTCSADGVSLCQNGAKCLYSMMNNEMYCDCPTGFYGEFCEVKMCDLVVTGACNSGSCIGDLVDWHMCDCPSGRGGLFCEKSDPDGEMTRCERHHRLTEYALSAITGKVPDDKMTVPMSEFLKKIEEDGLYVPNCWPHEGYNDGEYQSFCRYDIDSGVEEFCYCTNEEGEPNNYPYNLETKSCPGYCPPEWGKECKQPEWWCSEKVQCERGREKCSLAHVCDDEMCPREPQPVCVPKERRLPCDPRPCRDDPYSMCQPCGINGYCINLDTDEMSMDDDDDDDEMNYLCRCKQGYSGKDCEISNTICNMIPDGLCEMGCIGDIGSGHLCRCEAGYGGILCDTPARTSCERRRALYGNALAILQGNMTVDGYDMSEVQELIRMVVMIEGGNSIPVFTCTETGFYDKVQCMTSVDDMQTKYCQCVDHNGNFIDSNTEIHINYDVCTAPTDFRQMGKDLCALPDFYAQQGLQVTICMNKGECVFDILDGKVCKCPDGYSGQFCETAGGQAESRSLCEYMADAWDITHKIFTDEASWITSEIQKQLYLNVTFSFLHPQGHMALKAECEADGTFKPAACYYDVTNRAKGLCYCWGLNGPILGREVDGPESAECGRIQQEQCSELEMCPGLRCEFGYKQNIVGCPICACKIPCETMKCDAGHRCVVERMKDCDEDEDKPCIKAMCMPKEKPGACPGYDYDSVVIQASIPGGGLADLLRSDSDSCPVNCFDDSDCEGEKKCCGLCGSKCVDPQVLHSCRDDQMRMDSQQEFLLKAREELVDATNMTKATMRLLERIADAELIWMPSCHSNGFLYEPRQCVYTLDSASLESREPVSCFCVDRLGNRVPGAVASLTDAESCMTKPFSCPFVEELNDPDDAPHCEEDLDCVGGLKCCGTADNDLRICVKPVDEAKLSTTVDRLMSDLCKEDSDMCQGASCIGDWQKEGTACLCPTGRYGPFCAQTGTDGQSMTACQKKVFARSVFLQQMAEAETQSSGIAELVRRDIMKKMAEMGPAYEEESITAIWWTCTDTGDYSPMQCIVEVTEGMDLTGNHPTYCFCVDEDGKEILGTRMPAKDGRRPFCGDADDFKTCPVGHAYRNSDGLIVMGTEGCPDGYSSMRSTYGHTYCCPNEKGRKDVCSLPMDIGMTCPTYASGMEPTTRFYFDDDDQECKSFPYRGCAGNRNSFSTMDACNARCKENAHPGSCPSTPVKVVVRGQCEDQCGGDDECDESYKCCRTTCGMRCIPVSDDDTMDKERCPIGQARQSKDGGACNKNKPCDPNYMCMNKGGNADAGGFCCPDYQNAGLCEIPPMETEKCTDPMERYFYNATSMMCEKFHFSGCTADFNNFKTLDDCCNTCNAIGRCRVGKCPNVRLGLVATCQNECSADAECPGKKICCSNGCGNVCVVPEVDEVSDCLTRQLEARRTRSVMADDDSCDLVNMPMCEKDGSWSQIQCQTALGICWCVTPNGYYIDGTVTRGVPKCGTALDVRAAELAKMDIADVDFSVCPGGEDAHCCPKALCNKKCPAHPDAKCRINPCGGCEAEFYSPAGEKVDCDEGLSTCQKELKTAATALQEHQMTARMASGKETDEMEDDMEGYKEKMDQEKSSAGWTVSTRYPGRCVLYPDPSMCEGFMPQWYFDPARGTCDLFIWGMCGGNDNRFATPEDCFQACDPLAHPCMNVSCPSDKPKCELQYDEMCYMSEEGCEITTVCTEEDSSSHMVMDIFVPRCLSTGEYQYKQCHDDYCWCVNSQGLYVGGLTREDTISLMCNASGVVGEYTPPAACANDQSLNPACIKACTGKTCPGQPTARCVADLCSADCNTKFVDHNGEEVECTGDKCSVFTFEEKSVDQCAARVLCQGSQMKNCPESVCERAMMQNCSKNPCAICQVDPCTCKPYFIDVNTKERFTNAQCQYISLGSCELKKCNVLSEIEKAKFNKIDLANAEEDIPDCDEQGKFKVKQCKGSKCQCVDEFGAPVESEADGSCKKIDKIKQVRVTFTFKADFSKFKNNNKLMLLKDEILKKLQENGIDPLIIKEIGEPYAGSIKVDVIFEENPDATNKDMTVIYNVVSQMNNTGTMDLTVDGETIPLESTAPEAKTESQIGEEKPEPKDDDDDGLDTTEIVIIACVCGGIGLIVIAVIIYFVCCRKRQAKEAVDDTYDHIRENKSSTYDKPVPLYNQAYEDDGQYMKVRM